jgi:hypothetical protein
MENWTDKASLIARRIRQIGIARILYGSDSANGEGLALETRGRHF